MRLNHILLGQKQGVTIKQCIYFSCVVYLLVLKKSKKCFELKGVSFRTLIYVCLL